MRNLFIAFVAFGTLAAGPASAQYGQYGHGGYQGGPNRGGAYDAGAFWRGAPDNPNQRIQFLQDRVNRGMADGSLDRREAGRVNGELNGVRTWIRRMHWQDDGRLTPDQRAQVQGRLDGIIRQIHWMRQNGW